MLKSFLKSQIYTDVISNYSVTNYILVKKIYIRNIHPLFKKRNSLSYFKWETKTGLGDKVNKTI